MADSLRRASARVLAFALAALPLSLLAQEPPTLPVVVITPTLGETPIDRVGSAVTVIGREELARRSPLTVADALRAVPGLDLTETGGPGATTTVRLRGANSGQTLVLIDGLRVNDAASSSGEFDFSTLMPSAIERIEVLRGPQSALYGSDAMGGVVNIITRRGGGPTTVEGSAQGGSYGTAAGDATVTGGADGWAWAVSTGASRTDGFSRYGYRIPRIESRFPNGLEDDGFDRLGGSARLGFRGENGVFLDLGAFGTRQRFEYDSAFGAFPDTPSEGRRTFWQGFARGGFDLFDGRLGNSLTVFRNETDRRFVDVGTNLPPALAARNATDFLGTRTGAEYQGTLRMDAAGRLVFGLRTEEEAIETSTQALFPMRRPVVPGSDEQQRTNSAYALWVLPLGERLDVSLGGRRDAVQDGETFDTWRATIAHRILETGTVLRASAGTGGKAPTLYQRFDPTFGDPSLEAERSFGADAGIDQRLLDGRARVSATVFVNRFRNLIDFDFANTPARPFGGFLNVARATTTGIEVAASVQLAPDFATLSLTYTHLEARDDITDRRLARRPRDSARIGLELRPTDRLTIEPVLHLVGERYSSANEVGRLQGYARLDLRAEYRIDQHWSVFARGENLTNARIEDPLNYGATGAAAYAGVRGRW